MTIKTMKIADLSNWAGNPRDEVLGPDRADLKASMLDKGQLVPLITRPLGNGKSEVIAGRTRRNILEEMVADGTWPADRDVMVDERDELVGDDAAALDIAISENIHIPMHAMDQFSAFMRLVDMGRKVPEIANAYGVSTRVVEQRLSFAKLNERARKLVKTNERDLDWASAMTLASGDEQIAILEEIESDARRYRNAAEVRMRLDNDLVSTKKALFDVSKVEAKLVRKDLFSNDAFMHVSDFLPLQEEALKEKVTEAEAEGWSRVSVKTDREFDRFKYHDGVQEPAKGEVVFVRHANGIIEEHRGLKLRSEEIVNTIDADHADAGEALFGDDSADVNDLRADSAETNDKAEDVYAEGKKTKTYLATSRAMIIQAHMMRNPKLSLAVTLAGLLGQTTARPVEGRLMNDSGLLSADNAAKRIVIEQVEQVAETLIAAGIDPTGGYDEMLEGLMGLDEAVLQKILQVEVAKRVRTDLPRIEQMFNVVDKLGGEDSSQPIWTADRGFLETLSPASLRILARDILPARLASKLGKSRSDMVESIAQITEDAVINGGRLQNHERDTLLAWRPSMLLTNAKRGDGADVFGGENDNGTDTDGEADSFFDGGEVAA